jgi:hypothetical protein
MELFQGSRRCLWGVGPPKYNLIAEQTSLQQTTARKKNINVFVQSRLEILHRIQLCGGKGALARLLTLHHGPLGQWKGARLEF